MIESMSCVNANKTKCNMFIEGIQPNNLNHIPNIADHLQKHPSSQYNIENYIAIEKVTA